MTTDDLRTRAREAADHWVDSAASNIEWERRDHQDWGFIEGYLAHAAQQPSREELARVMREAGLYRRQADAILALFDWPVS